MKPLRTDPETAMVGNLERLRREAVEADHAAQDVATRTANVPRCDTGLRAIRHAKDEIDEKVRTWERMSWDPERERYLASLYVQREQVQDALRALETARERLRHAEQRAAELPTSIRRQVNVVAARRRYVEEGERNPSAISGGNAFAAHREALALSERILADLRAELQALTGQNQ